MTQTSIVDFVRPTGATISLLLVINAMMPLEWMLKKGMVERINVLMIEN
jgi:hypothetical protein